MTAWAKFLGSKSSAKWPQDPEVNQTTAFTTPTSKRPRITGKVNCTNPHCPNPYSRHSIDNCFSFGGKKCGDYPPWWKGPTDLHLHPDKRSAETKACTAEIKKASASIASAHDSPSHSHPDGALDYRFQIHRLCEFNWRHHGIEYYCG